MLRLLELLLFASVLCRVLVGRWPWAALAAGLALPPRGDLQAARRALGVAAGADRAAVLAAHRQAMLTAHPDRGGDAAAAKTYNHARDVLLADIARNQETI